MVRCFFSIPYGIIDSNLAEFSAIRKALQLLYLNPAFHHVKITIESDSSNAIAWINNSAKTLPWKLHNELCLIDNLKAGFPLISFVHTLRENNSMADTLAKQGVFRDRDFIAWM